MEVSSYFIQGDDQAEYGPVNLQELKSWVMENRVGLNTPVRRKKEEIWRPWQEHPELVALLALARVQRRGNLPPDLVGLAMAQLWRRAIGWTLDNLLLISPLLIYLSIYLPETYAHLQALSQDGGSTVLRYPELIFIDLLFNAMQLFYFSLCLSISGATPVTWLLHIRVVDAHGNAPSFWRALLRSFFLILSVNIVPYALPLFYVFFNPTRRALHDLIAGTYVVQGRK